MRTIVHLIAILLLSALSTACTTEADRLMLEPAKEVLQTPTPPAKQGLHLFAPNAYSPTSPVKDIPCELEGIYYVDDRIKCGPVIKTSDGKLFLPVANKFSLSFNQIDAPIEVNFSAVPTQLFDTGVGDIEICETLQAVYLTCLTIRD